jgi:hypothetical protein
MRTERWFLASNEQATFVFCVDVDGRVSKVAPIGRQWMLGHALSEVQEQLRSNHYRLQRLAADPQIWS